MDVLGRVLVTGLLLAGCWAVYIYIPRFVQGSILAEFSILVPAGAVLLLLCFAHWLARRAGFES